ncbi:D-hexose-6-phosphate mutarotase [Thiobacter aerophilum]|uniref:Putative glucose-6-phosphate 1-epimerase n=1 Tax=Thiobacter aerophilum TaxID=3121275 RepID=A0ABV0EEZ3_9BURK
MSQHLDALNHRFGVSGQVKFKPGPGGMDAVEVTNEHASATILLQGAHLIDWTPKGEKPVIWTSPEAKFAPGKSVRGGVPVCWPWFGPHPTYADFPAHGFARTVPWEPIAVKALPEGTWLAFRLIPTDATRTMWPHATELVLQMVIGKTLDLDLATWNRGNTSITIGDALHTYFAVGDVRFAKIHGLHMVEYLDKVDGGARKVQLGPVIIDREVDRIYLDTPDTCVIEDTRFARRIRISKQNSHSTVVWNPWLAKAAAMGDLGPDGYLHMVCVESANAADDVVTLAPGGEHHLWVRYQLEPI